ncbi:TlpA family protein disulfide reductase [Aureivirga sp. CE67]|uniref:TlpA family protein disulfide reductase n=1 Tax=Aureivirga sp. CE67 TaxID=1788983 RepID=UPI0018CA144A|nr:TlpA disulfide reductase family protein [Aureivirga sp. CE67]
MKNLLLILSGLLFSISLYAKSGKITISGQVENQKDQNIRVTKLSGQPLFTAELDENGNFDMKFRIKNEGYYRLKYNRKSFFIYLYPKDDFFVKFDANDIENTFVFDGAGAERNNYLAEKQNAEFKLKDNIEAFYKVTGEEYLKNLENLKEMHLASLEKSNVETFFIESEKKSLEYEYLNAIDEFKSSYKYLFGEDIVLSENFYQPINNFKINSYKDYNKQPYFRFLVNSYWEKQIENTTNVSEMLNVLRQIPEREVISQLVLNFYYNITPENDRAQDYLELVKKVTNNQRYIEACENKYKEIVGDNKLRKGDVSPSFSFESIDGEIVNLSDFKGKYVYIDVWATWCGPCLKQIPYLKALEEEYIDKDIVFVSISVDNLKDKINWKKMVNTKQLSGVQLFADKSFDSEFMTAYGVGSIPYFILIDKEGKIIDTKAPRPSHDKTMELLDELLK